jgi:hypothetical protein
MGVYDEAFRATQFYNMPVFPRAVADLRVTLAADKANPKAYLILADAEQ